MNDKAILISIKPQWCELIAQGKKTVEVRKTRPKTELPFKCYIYCTKSRKAYESFGVNKKPDECGGKVIGEFICDYLYGITNFVPYDSDDFHHAIYFDVEETCLEDWEIDEYLGQKDGFGWHISDLVIYDRPKELSDFIHTSNGCCNEGKCRGCRYFDSGNGYNIEDDCNADFDTDMFSILKRPPQSWCYVNEIEG